MPSPDKLLSTMNDTDPVVITAAARTPIGSFQGALAPNKAPMLGAVAIRACIERSGIQPEDIDEVLMGCVLSAGQGQAPARQASLGAGIPAAADCTTINKMCGSGMKSVMLAHDLLVAGSNRVMVAGGMESMTNAPYLLDKARSGYRIGHQQVKDHLFLDGLEDAYEPGRLMGSYAEDCAQHYQLTREAQDEFAITSLNRALKAIASGSFDPEIIPITVQSRLGNTEVCHDEQPGKANIAKIPTLKPAFRGSGTVTAANASSISDGAAALMMMRALEAERRGIQPLATVVGHATYAGKPALFPTAPIYALRMLLDKINWNPADAGLFEINEAFAVVTMAAMLDLGLPHDCVNVHGGACALGHPIGASGARIIVTLLAAMEKYDVQRGVAALCIGGGEATAIALSKA